MDRRAVLKSGGAVALGMMAIGAVAAGTTPAFAVADGSDGYVPLPDPATGDVTSPPYPKNLTAEEKRNLQTFDELDFDVFSHADWARLGKSHAQNVRCHWPDGHFTDGIQAHIDDLAALFVWSPTTRIEVHPLRVAKDDLTAVTGVMKGAFTKPMPDGKGGTIAPTGKEFAINMATVGIWNRQGVMDEEFLFWDNQTFYHQIGLA